MRISKWASTLFLVLLLVAGCATLCVRAAAQEASYSRQLSEDSLNSVVTILIEEDGVKRAVGTGLVVRGDGVILTAYHLVKSVFPVAEGARSVSVRLRNGETFDNV